MKFRSSFVIFTAWGISSRWFVSGFSVSMFQEQVARQKMTFTKTEGVEIELPDFEELFHRIQQVSPLARLTIEGGKSGVGGGFAKIDDTWPSNMQWKLIESNKRKIVHRIDRIDNFQQLGCPIVRFRASLKGPCSGRKFAEFIMNLDERKHWDSQIDDVYESHSIYDLEAANLAMGVGKYGDCSLLGVGYVRSKGNFVVDGREQLTLCGVQNFSDGSCLIWGTELEDWHNHLFPQGQRHTRAKSHLFSTTLVPTGPDSFDVEYVLQLEVGGKIPPFLTTPVLIETVKSLFNYASSVYENKEVMDKYIQRKADVMEEKHSILMTP